METHNENIKPAEASTSKAPHQKLAPGYRIGPNGVILGPDGKPCRACNSLKAFGAVASGGKSSNKGKSPAVPAVAGAGAAAVTAIAATPADEDEYKACPPDVEQLGRHSWTFLHTTAAYYPPQPSEEQKKHASALFNSLPTLYPCSFCATELKQEIKTVGPPDVNNGEALSKWLCKIHNEVNVRLGKKEFDCSQVLKRWKDGWDDGRC